MKAIGFTQHLNIDDPRSLFEFKKAIPSPKGHDLLVKVSAVSVNPVDIGVRRNGHGQLTTPEDYWLGCVRYCKKKWVSKCHYLRLAIGCFTPDPSGGQEAIANIS